MTTDDLPLGERIASAIEDYAEKVRGDITQYDELAIRASEAVYRAARISRELLSDEDASDIAAAHAALAEPGSVRLEDLKDELGIDDNPGPFRPFIHYDPDGDIIDAHWSEDNTVSEWVMPGLVIHRSRETGEVVGVLVDGVEAVKRRGMTVREERK